MRKEGHKMLLLTVGMMLAVCIMGLISIKLKQADEFNRTLLAKSSALEEQLTTLSEYIVQRDETEGDRIKAITSEVVKENNKEIEKRINANTKKQIDTLEKKVDANQQYVYEKTKVRKQTINDNFDVMQRSNLSVEQLKNAVDEGSKRGMLDVVEYVVNAEKKYGVNSVYLLSTLAYESGWGRIKSASNNIAGWTSTKGGFRSFNSINECVDTVAKGISTFYKDSVGTKLGAVTKMYCPDPGYSNELKIIMNDIQSNAV